LLPKSGAKKKYYTNEAKFVLVLITNRVEYTLVMPTSLVIDIKQNKYIYNFFFVYSLINYHKQKKISHKLS